MLQRLKKTWREVRNGVPGKRFQDRHKRRRGASRKRPAKPLLLTAGGLLLAVGLVLLAIPGPGIPFVVLGGALVARESLRAARALDWAELRARAVAAWGTRAWRRASPAARGLLVSAVLALAAGGAYVSWLVLFE